MLYVEYSLNIFSWNKKVVESGENGRARERETTAPMSMDVAGIRERKREVRSDKFFDCAF